MTPSTFDLDYELTPADLNAWEDYWIASYAHKILHSRAINLLLALLGAITGLAVVGVFRLVVWTVGLQWDPLLYWLYFYGAVGGVLVMVLAFKRERSTFKRKLLAKLSNRDARKRYEQLVGRRRLTASADGFKLASPVGSTSRNWKIVSGVRTMDSHVFILADVTVIIPRNAFSTATECDEFIAAVENWSHTIPEADRTLDRQR